MNREGVQLDLGRLKEVKPGELAVRFVFGASVSAIAAGIAIVFGARLGGAFLAFPAIMPATVTLVAEEESESDARETAAGAVLGAPGMTTFAVVVALLATVIGMALVLGAAAATWLVTVLAAFVLNPLEARDRS